MCVEGGWGCGMCVVVCVVSGDVEVGDGVVYLRCGEV